MKICGKYLGGGKRCGLLHNHRTPCRPLDVTSPRVVPLTAAEGRVVPLTTGSRIETPEEALPILDRAHKMSVSSQSAAPDSTLYGMAAEVIRKQAAARMIRSAKTDDIAAVLLALGVSTEADDDRVFCETLARALQERFTIFEKDAS